MAYLRSRRGQVQPHSAVAAPDSSVQSRSELVLDRDHDAPAGPRADRPKRATVAAGHASRGFPPGRVAGTFGRAAGAPAGAGAVIVPVDPPFGTATVGAAGGAGSN